VTLGTGWRTADEWGGHRWKAGEEILDRYVVEGELGQGGMGVVYGCLDKVGGVRVAVKALPPELGHNSVEMEEVRENFELVYKLNHPNIASFKTLERDGRGEFFLVMDVAEGVSLRKWLREKWKAGGVSVEEAVAVLRQVASALDYAHGKKLVHRDVKPGNVMISPNGEVKVLDFGLAAQIRTSLSRASQAYRGTSGTGPYMAPEQWRAEPQDAKTDQYALAVMAYEMLAGRLPFENAELAVLKDAVLHGEAKRIPGLPKRAMAALRRGMAKESEGRFGSCGEFVEALAGGKTKIEQKGGWGWLASFLFALALAGAGAWWWRGETERRWKAEAERQELAQKAAEESRRQLEEARRAEETRLAREKEAEAARLAERRRAEDERLAAEKAAEEARLAEERKAQEETARLEAERVKAEREEQIRRQNEELEESVYRLQPLAKTKAGNTLAMQYDRGQGFGEKLDEMNDKLAQGEAAMGGRNFAKAKEYFEASMAAAAWCEENAPLREEAKRARHDAAGAKKQADAIDGAQLGLRNYRRGNEKALAGKMAFEKADFRDAADAWEEAEKAYKQAEADAENTKIAQGLETARGAKRRGAWEDCLEAAEGVLAFASGNTEAKTLKAEARKQIDEKKSREEAEKRKEEAEARKAEEARRAKAEETRRAAEAKKTMEAGRTKTITLPGGAAMEMVWCPPGSFMMGSPASEKGRDVDETQHRVTLTKGFWMAKYEVTQKQWKSVMGNNPSHFKGDDRPVDSVSWERCQEFCRETGLQLPTEAQWEYACRAGSTGPYGGNGKMGDMGWYDWNSGFMFTKRTHPVGEKRANAWGLHDMHGNVEEWCADGYRTYSHETETDPMGPSTGSDRIWRGGDYYCPAKNCRSAFRFSYNSKATFFNLGFRPCSVE
jgi:formylglycine-generating enzyme required for sulfatase activity